MAPSRSKVGRVRAQVHAADDAAREFLSNHHALICRLASERLRGLRTELQAADLAQEVMATLFVRLQRGAIEAGRIRNPPAYLRVMTRRAARRAFATCRESVALAVDETQADSERFPTPEAATVRADAARFKLRALESDLHPRDAAALTLLVEEGLDIAEVAERLGCTRNSVYQMRCRIVAAARRIEDQSV